VTNTDFLYHKTLTGGTVFSHYFLFTLLYKPE